MTVHEYKKGLRIQLNKDDIEILSNIDWIEMGTLDATMIIDMIVNECVAYERRRHEKN